MNAIPEDLRFALQIQAEGAENIVRVCTELFDFASDKMSGESSPTLGQRQQAYRFVAATAGVWVSLKLVSFPNIERFAGFQQSVQEMNCIHVCRMENFASEIGDALFKATWEKMFDDAQIAYECLTTAAHSDDTANFRQYPQAYFMKRHQIDITHFEGPTIYFGVAIAALDLPTKVAANMANVDAAYAKHFPL